MISLASAAPISRKSSDWVTAAQLRVLLKSNLGLNARQVSVSTSGTNRWLTITIRDVSVSVAAVEQFAATFDTMISHQDDSYSGQSVDVKTTAEVDLAHGAPFVDEIKRIAPMVAMDCGVDLTNGASLWLSPQGYYVTREDRRRPYVHAWDVLNGSEWAVNALAKHAARV